MRRREPDAEQIADPFPSPPFPDPDNEILQFIISCALTAHEEGQVDIAGAVTHAAVHAWYEGHIQGEDACPGCKYRGELPKQQLRGWLSRGSTPN